MALVSGGGPCSDCWTFARFALLGWMSGRVLGQVMESETEIVTFEPPLRLTTKAIRGPRLTTCFVLESLADATRVSIDVNGEVPGGALGAMLAEGFLRRELNASLDRLRVLGESAHGC